MRIGVDYSYDHPTGAQLASAGMTFAMRYINGTGGKQLTRDEINDLHGHGLDIGLIIETSAQAPLMGFNRGVQHAGMIRQFCNDMKVPATVVVYGCVDWDASISQLGGAVKDYFAGLRTSGRLIGVYGGKRSVSYFLDRGYGSAWQTYAWSKGAWDDRAKLRQVRNGVALGSGTVDRCEDHGAYGLWQAPRQAGPTIPPLPRIMRHGDRGSDVRTVQQRLIHYGYNCGATDGIFGALTDGSVRRFQMDRHVATDGIVGPVTWALLWK